jgi:hypothetical protein
MLGHADMCVSATETVNLQTVYVGVHEVTHGIRLLGKHRMRCNSGTCQTSYFYTVENMQYSTETFHRRVYYTGTVLVKTQRVG